ncbi:MAG: asparagine synthase-related protein [Halobacteriaceae archaeon]
MSATSDADVRNEYGRTSMNKELFGVFGPADAFDRVRDRGEFDAVVEGPAVTVGLRAPGLDVPGRSSVWADPGRACVLFGEAVRPSGPGAPARQVLDRYGEVGVDAFAELNGSYLAVVDVDGAARVVTDPIRSWECYYADVDGVRVFGTDVSAVRGLLENPTVDRMAVLEMLHLGTVLGEATLFEEVRRVPFDGTLTASGVDSLSRFVYDPREFDHEGQLAERLSRAIRRRDHYPGRHGLLLSGGQDSRVFLSTLPGVETTYTIGRPDSREVRVARRVAAQYGAAHRALEPGSRYLYPSDEKVLYGQGVKEALHIHHAGYDDELDADVMYHGLLFDTLFKGYFLERDGLSVFGSQLPSDSLASDPDPVPSLLDTLGFLPDGSRRLADAVTPLFEDAGVDVDLTLPAPRAFLRERMEAELETCWERADSAHNATDLLVIKNQPVLPFRTHLADNYFEAFVAADADLLAWHLATPPAERNGTTFRRALTRLDDDILRYRPPSQPHASTRLNQLERFVRRKVPFVERFEPAWPDRQDLYEETRLAERLFPEHGAVHELPARQQLRVNDVRWWLS